MPTPTLIHHHPQGPAVPNTDRLLQASCFPAGVQSCTSLGLGFSIRRSTFHLIYRSGPPCHADPVRPWGTAARFLPCYFCLPRH